LSNIYERCFLVVNIVVFFSEYIAPCDRVCACRRVKLMAHDEVVVLSMSIMRTQRKMARNSISIYQIARMVLSALAGFFLGRISLEGFVSPFAPAFAAAAWTGLAQPGAALVGSLAGLALSTPFPSTPLAVTLCASLLGFLFKIKPVKYGIRIVAIAAVAVSTTLLIDGRLTYTALTGLAGAGLTVLMYMAFTMAAEMITGPKRSMLSHEEVTGLALCGCAAVIGLGKAEIFGISLGGVLATFICMTFAYLGGSGAGAAAGAVMGLAGSIGGMDALYIGNMAVCSMVAGSLRKLKRPGSAIGFILANAVLTLYLNGSSIRIIKIQDMLIAGILLNILPKRVISYLGRFADSYTRRAYDERLFATRLKELALSRLKEISTVFKKMADAFTSINDARSVERDITTVIRPVSGEVCGNCAMHKACWVNGFYTTYAECSGLFEHHRQRGDLSCPPDTLLEGCLKRDELIRELDIAYRNYNLNLQAENRVEESRQLVGKQLTGVAGVINSIAAQIDVETSFDQGLEAEIVRKLDMKGIKAQEVLARSAGKIEVHVVIKQCGGKLACQKIIEKVVSAACNRKMGKRQGICNLESKSSCHLVFEEAPAMEVSLGAAMRMKKGEIACGDNHSMLKLKDGRLIVCLSDGMGTGERAAKESRATVSLVENFYQAGFEESAIFDTINKLMVLRSAEDMYSTADVCVIDLIEGMCRFIKIGSMPSYIAAKQGIKQVSSGSLPIGVLEELQPCVSEIRIEQGDIVFMMTDGVYDKVGGESGVKELVDWAVKEHGESGAQGMADAVISRAESMQGHSDDMTAIVIKAG
jgi:stage II sporulation protein E